MFPDLLHLKVFWFADIYINKLIQEIHLFGHKVDSGLKYLDKWPNGDVCI